MSRHLDCEVFPPPNTPGLCRAYPGYGSHRCLLHEGHEGKHRCAYCGLKFNTAA